MAVETQVKNEKEVKRRWTAGRKKEAVLRLLRGEPIDNLRRELGVTMAQLEEWRETVLTRMELLLKDRIFTSFSFLTCVSTAILISYSLRHTIYRKSVSQSIGGIIDLCKS